MAIRPYRSSPKFNALFFGPAGNGKTTLAYSAQKDPRMTPILAINFAGNPQSVRVDESVTQVIEVDTPNDIKDVTDALAKGSKTLFKWPTDQIKTVIIDTLTQANRAALNTVQGTDLKDIAKLSSEAQKMMMQQYGQVLNWLTLAAFIFSQKVTQHSIVTCQEKLDDYSPTKYPNLTGQAVGEVTGYYNIVGRCSHAVHFSDPEKEAIAKLIGVSKNDLKFILQTTPGNGIPIAKVQYEGHTVPPYMNNTTITEILNRIPCFNESK
jgi:AAA domain